MRINKILLLTFVCAFLPMIFTSCDPNGLKPLGGNGSIKDIDGNVYDSVVIGSQVWMAQNLRVTHYKNGDKIPMLANDYDWASTKDGAWCNYKNNGSYSKDYGRLYNQIALFDDRGLAPEGWRVATYNDWLILKKYLIKNGYNSNNDTVSNKIAMSMAGKTLWESFSGVGLIGDDLAANNKSGFNALPGGGRNYDGYFGGAKRNGYWWTTFGFTSLTNSSDSLDFKTDPERCGFSVRCIRDTKNY
jgi:uncharacterized protein (TIGR02145 family)